MAKFRKKPVVIEARQYTRMGLEAEKVAGWCGGQQTDRGLVIHTLEGDHLANYNDWVIQGVKGVKKSYSFAARVLINGKCVFSRSYIVCIVFSRVFLFL